MLKVNKQINHHHWSLCFLSDKDIKTVCLKINKIIIFKHAFIMRWQQNSNSYHLTFTIVIFAFIEWSEIRSESHIVSHISCHWQLKNVKHFHTVILSFISHIVCFISEIKNYLSLINYSHEIKISISEHMWITK